MDNVKDLEQVETIEEQKADTETADTNVEQEKPTEAETKKGSVKKVETEKAETKKGSVKKAGPKKYKVETPVKNYCGVGAGGIQFANGEATVCEGSVLDWYREHGYKVTEK